MPDQQRCRALVGEELRVLTGPRPRTCSLAAQLHDELLVAEAAQLAAGWRFVITDGIAIECADDLELYERVLFAFHEAARSRENRHASTSSRLTLGIRGEDADQHIAALRVRLDVIRGLAAAGRFAMAPADPGGEVRVRAPGSAVLII